MSTVPVRQVRLGFRKAKVPAASHDDGEKAKFRSSLSAVEFDSAGETLFLGGDETVESTPSIEGLRRSDSDHFGGESDAHTSFAIEEFIASLPDGSVKDGKKAEIDIEGLSISGGYLWVVGSHSANRKQPKETALAEGLKKLADVKLGKNRQFLGRIPIAGAKDGSTLEKAIGSRAAARLDGNDADENLLKALAQDVHLGPFLQEFKNESGFSVPMIPGKDNGFDIEGLAVSGERIFLGLRGPVLRGWAVILEIGVEDKKQAGELRLRPFPNGGLYRKHFVNLRGLGVRDLCWRDHDLFIMAGPTMALDGPSYLIRWDGALDLTAAGDSMTDLSKADKIPLPCGDGCDHPEGMALIPNPAGSPTEVLVVYDSPAEERYKDLGATEMHADVFKLP